MNFRIVEGERDYSDIYEDLKQDLLDGKNQLDTRKKYDLSVKQFHALKQQMIDEGVEFPETYYGAKKPENRYIYWNRRDNCYMIVKSIRGKTKRFGTYDNLEDARFVRDKLLENKWNRRRVLPLIVKRATQGSGSFNKHKYND